MSNDKLVKKEIIKSTFSKYLCRFIIENWDELKEYDNTYLINKVSEKKNLDNTDQATGLYLFDINCKVIKQDRDMDIYFGTDFHEQFFFENDEMVLGKLATYLQVLEMMGKDMVN